MRISLRTLAELDKPTVTYLLTYLFTHLLTYLLTYLLTLLLTHLFTYIFTHLLTYSLIYLLIYILTYLLNHLLTHSLTPCCTVLLEQLIGLQPVKKFAAFHGTRRFITALTSPSHIPYSNPARASPYPPHHTS